MEGNIRAWPASLRGKLKGRMTLCACVGGRERIQINSADYEIRKIHLLFAA